MIIKPTADFISTTFDVALAQGEDGSITAKIGTGLSIPATNSFLQVDYNSTDAVGDPNGPETIFYAAYNSGTGALTGVVRGQAGTTDVAHDAGAEVQCGMSTAFLHDDTGWIPILDTWTYASATTITVPSGAASLYSVGDKVKIVQGVTTKYFYVVTVADTLLTVTGGSDYTVANAAISGIYISKAVSPVGFPQWFAYAPTPVMQAGTRSGVTDIFRFNINNRTVIVHGESSWTQSANNALWIKYAMPVNIATGLVGNGFGWMSSAGTDYAIAGSGDADELFVYRYDYSASGFGSGAACVIKATHIYEI